MDTSVDFLGIGAARAGTTWLWSILKEHPDIWMPPVKELNYFNRSSQYPSPRPFQEERFFRRLFGTQEHNFTYRKFLRRNLRQTISSPRNWGNLGWVLRYLFNTVNDQWYLSLFDSRKRAVKGEITPGYSLLSLKDVEHVHDLLANLKIIFIIRNPIERAWSHLRFRWTNGILDINKMEEVKKAVDHPQLSLQGDYSYTYENWSSCFPREQFFIGFFDDIVERPQKLITELFAYLNVDPTYPIPEEYLRGRVNAARDKDIPEQVKQYLAKKYYPEVMKIIPLVGGYSEEWLKDIKGILG